MGHRGIEAKNGSNGSTHAHGARGCALAVILARAGSKGVPGKNTLSIAGKACIAWTIEAALQAQSVARVVVSTDDDFAKGVAKKLGVEVVDRPALLADDRASVDEALRHAVEQIDARSQGAAAPDPIVMLYASVPVRPHDLIDRAVGVFLAETADSVQSYEQVGKHHPWWTCRVNPQTHEVAPWEGNTLFHDTFRRQDLPPAHIPDGGVTAVARRALFLQIPEVRPGPHAFLGRPSHRRGVVTHEGDVVDIDSRIDLIAADALLRERNRRSLVGSRAEKAN